MKDVITRQTVVDKLVAYLHHELSLSGLVAWAETSLMDGEFDDNHFSVIRESWPEWGLPMSERSAWPFDKLRTGLGGLRTPAPAIRLFSPYPDRSHLITGRAASGI